jgi:hypothetical protein
LARLREDRDQLLAEASLREAEGEELTLPRELWSTAEKEQRSREVVDPWALIIEEKLEERIAKGTRLGSSFEAVDAGLGLTEWRVSFEFLASAVGLSPNQQHVWAGTRIREIMEQQGWRYKDGTIRIGGHNVRGYVKQGAKPAPKSIEAEQGAKLLIGWDGMTSEDLERVRAEAAKREKKMGISPKQRSLQILQSMAAVRAKQGTAKTEIWFGTTYAKAELDRHSYVPSAVPLQKPGVSPGLKRRV